MRHDINILSDVSCGCIEVTRSHDFFMSSDYDIIMCDKCKHVEKEFNIMCKKTEEAIVSDLHDIVQHIKLQMENNPLNGKTIKIVRQTLQNNLNNAIPDFAKNFDVKWEERNHKCYIIRSVSINHDRKHCTIHGKQQIANIELNDKIYKLCYTQSNPSLRHVGGYY